MTKFLELIINIVCLLTYDKSGGSVLVIHKINGHDINYYDVNRDFYLNN